MLFIKNNTIIKGSIAFAPVSLNFVRFYADDGSPSKNNSNTSPYAPSLQASSNSSTNNLGSNNEHLDLLNEDENMNKVRNIPEYTEKYIEDVSGYTKEDIEYLYYMVESRENGTYSKRLLDDAFESMKDINTPEERKKHLIDFVTKEKDYIEYLSQIAKKDSEESIKKDSEESMSPLDYVLEKQDLEMPSIQESDGGE